MYISNLREFPQNIQSHAAAFFRVELAAVDVPLLHGSGDGNAGFRHSGEGIVAVFREEGVDEVDILSVKSYQQGAALYFQRVPAHVGNLQFRGQLTFHGDNQSLK